MSDGCSGAGWRLARDACASKFHLLDRPSSDSSGGGHLRGSPAAATSAADSEYHYVHDSRSLAQQCIGFAVRYATGIALRARPARAKPEPNGEIGILRPQDGPKLGPELAPPQLVAASARMNSHSRGEKRGTCTRAGLQTDSIRLTTTEAVVGCRNSV